MPSPSLASQLWTGLAGRIVQSMAAGAVGQALSIAYRLLLPPLFLQAWGVGLYGDWLLLSSLTAYLALADVGGGMYVINRCTQLYATKDLAQFRATMQTALIAFTALPGAVLAIITIAVYALPPSAFHTFKFMGSSDLQAVAVVMAVQIFVSIPQSLVLGTYRTIGEMPRGVMLANGIMLLQLIFVGTGLISGASLPIVALLQLLPVPIITIIALIDLRRRSTLDGLYSSWKFDLRTAKRMFAPSLQFFLIQFSQAMSIQGTLILAGVVLGSLQLVQFATTRTLANVSRSAIGLMINSAWPEITRLDSIKDHAKLRDLFLTIFSTSAVIATTIGTGLIIFGREIYSTWLNQFDMYDANIMFLTITWLTMQVNWTVYASLLMATNQHQSLSNLTAATSLLSIGFAYLGALAGGLEGMIIGIAASEITLLIAVPLLARRHYSFLTYRTLLANALPLLAVPLMHANLFFSVVIVPTLLLWWAHTLRQFVGKQRGKPAS